jgi:hypothetical protein
MTGNWKTMFTTAAVLAALAGGSSLYAQTTAPAKPQSGGMMMQGQQGDMTGMMNMMSQMNQMVDTCNKMMQDMDTHHQPQQQKDGTGQPKKS